MTIRKWRNEFLVNTTTAGDQDQSAVTSLKDGGFVIAWRDNIQPESSVRFQRYDAAGLRLGGESTLASNMPASYGDKESPALTGLANGGFWLSVAEEVAIAGDFDIQGSFLAGDFRSNGPRGSTSNADNEINPALASLGVNGAVSVWENTTLYSGEIRMSILAANGTAVLLNGPVEGDPFFTSNYAQGNPDVAATKDGSKFVVAWQFGDSAGGIHARVFNANGTQFAAEFSASVSGFYTQDDPVVAWLDNSKFAVACTNEAVRLEDGGDGNSSAIMYAIHADDGSVLLSRQLANTTRAGEQSRPSITALPDGGFVIAWVDYSHAGVDASGSAIRLQSFDAVGDKRGGEILVNTATFADQLDVDLAALADGRVVVTWTDLSGSASDSSGTAIRAQIVDPRDGIIDGTAQADKLYGHDAVGDIISCGDGNDAAFGLAGNDTIYGSQGDDTLNGGTDQDTLYGGDGADALTGDQGDDELFGEAGNDILRGSAGGDLLDGGNGRDGANYGGSTTAVRVALDGAFAATGDALGDTLVSIENLQGTQAAVGDNLRGDAGNNVLFGRAGNDTLRGMSGTDQLIGGLGGDTLRGDLGNDLFTYNATNEGGDSVLDFSNAAANNDAFMFRRSVFLGSGAALPSGVLNADRFATRAADHVAPETDDNFIFQINTRQLWYDATGSNNGATDAVLIATLQAGATMSNADIVM